MNNNHNITLLNTDWLKKLQQKKNIGAAGKVEAPIELTEEMNHFYHAFHAEFFDPTRKRSLEVEALELKLYQQSVYSDCLQVELLELRRQIKDQFFFNSVLMFLVFALGMLGLWV